MSHISILMENQPGALSRVVGLFSQRGYNIDSLSVLLLTIHLYQGSPWSLKKKKA